MGEMISSAIISFIVETVGNFLFNKKLDKKVGEKVALDSKISYIHKTENKQDHNQNNQNVINSNVIGNNNKTMNYNQNIQVINETNINYSDKTTTADDPLTMIIFLVAISIAISSVFFWLKNNIPHYSMICFFIFFIGLIFNKIYSYNLIKKYNYLFLEKDKYMLFSVVLLLVMILVYSNTFESQNYLQIEEQFKGITNFKTLLEQLSSLANLNFMLCYSIKNIMQVLIVIVPLIDVLFSMYKKRETLLLRIKVSNFVLLISLYFFIFYLPNVILYFN